MMKIFVETERLILREVMPEDVGGFFELDADPEVHRYLGNKPVKSPEQSKETIAHIRKQYVENGIGRWAIINKANGEFMGWTGLKLVQEEINNHINFYDLGYRLIRKYWGQGIATESGIASLNYGFDHLDTEVIYAAAHVENYGSNNILRKLGFTFIEDFDHEGEKDNWYRIEKGEWVK